MKRMTKKRKEKPSVIKLDKTIDLTGHEVSFQVKKN